MNKIIVLTIIFSSILPFNSVLAEDNDLAQKLAGRILLQVESYGRAWYIDPLSHTRYYLQGGNEAYFLMRTKALGITNSDLAKIPTKEGQAGNKKLIERLKGRILLQVEKRGEAWYVDPTNGLRYYLKNGEAAYELMKSKGLGIKNKDLAQIEMNSEQIVHDTTFNDVAYVSFDGQNFLGGYNDEQILPLASLTKLITALVFLDTNPDWNKKITITNEQIEYPKTLVGNDATSEVDLAAGDTLSVYDLWMAMLISSSNQAAVILADNCGLSRQEFVEKMNQKSEELELKKTKFYEMTGLDSHNVTNAKEMAKIAYEAFKKEKILEVHKYQNYTISALNEKSELKEIKVLDRNYSLQKFNPEASKTGYLIEAQRTVALKKDGKIITVLHALSMSQRNNIIEKLIKL